MVRAIIAWSLQNRLLVLLGVAGLVAFGMYAAVHLNVEAYPDPTPPLIEVISQKPGASPEEMERLVGIPIETALNGIPGLVDLRSISIAGLNDIKCQFSYDTDYATARQEVLNRLAAVDRLPPGVTPRLSPWSPTGEIVRYVLEGPGYTTNQLKAVQDWVLNRLLKQVPGVADVTGYGGTVKQYQVLLYPRYLKKYGIQLKQVEEAIARSNANVGGNVLTLGSQSHNVRALGLLGQGIDPLDPAHVDEARTIEADKLDDIADVVVATNADGTPVYVRQLAQVVVGHQPRLGVVGRGNENDVVEGIVLMRRGSKASDVSDAVLAKFQEIEEQKLLPEGMRIRVFNQRSALVHSTTRNVLHNLVVGMGLVVAVLFVFLGDVASAVIVALSIPLSLLIAISVLYLQGKSANLLSIGAVDFGIIVDSAVIVVENIHRHVTGHEEVGSLSLIDRIVRASDEIQRPLFFSRLIIVCAFLPLFLMVGPAQALFGPMANTYAFAIVGALIVSLTLSPVLCSFWFKNKKEERETLLNRGLKGAYRWALVRILRHRALALLLIGGLVTATIAMIPGLGGEFMPELEEGNLWIRVALPPTIAREEAARLAPRIRSEIAAVNEVRGVMSHVGRPDDGTDVTSFANLEFNVPLKPMEEWREGMTRLRIQDEITERLKPYVGINVSFSQLIRDNVQEALSGVKGANSIKVFGTDLVELEKTADTIVETLRGVPGVSEVGLFHVVGQPNLEIEIDRHACARFGINVDDVEEVIEVAVGGRAFSQMVEGEKLYDIVLRLPQEFRDDPASIARLSIDVSTTDGTIGPRIPLSAVAKITPHAVGATTIYRENNRRYIPIKFSVRGRDLASAIAEAQAKIAAANLLPRGYRLEWSGEFAQMEQANARLVWVVPISLVLIALLLYSALDNVKDAMLVLANVVTATMGGIWALKLTHTSFSISAAVGFISIFGVAVMSGLLLISYFKQLRAEGMPLDEAIVEGSCLRFRPVVMTSLTAILGMLPAALATEIGTQAQKPLAIVVVGGLTVSLALTQYLMPVLYSLLPGPHPGGEAIPANSESLS